MKAAREMLKRYDLDDDDESGSVAGIMAGYCRLLDDSERDVQDAALAWCRQNDPCEPRERKGSNE